MDVRLHRDNPEIRVYILKVCVVIAANSVLRPRDHSMVLKARLLRQVISLHGLGTLSQDPPNPGRWDIGRSARCATVLNMLREPIEPEDS
jgi:hypothetical protein